MKTTAVTCVKNEGPFVLEWIAYNRVIGITGQLFYSNDCDDGTDTLLDGLAGHGVIQHLPNPAKGRKFQMEALRHARRQDIVKQADWVWVADVDEFLNIRIGNGTLPELVRACGDPAAISVSHQYFANGGIEGFADDPVVKQFQHSHNPDIWCDRMEIEVKTLVRVDFPAHYYGVHRPYLAQGLKPRQYPAWTDGSGRPVPRRFMESAGKRRIFGFDAAGSRRFATVNHYALRSLESYLVKSDRGDANRDYRFFDDSYWRERNDGAYHDTSIQRHMAALEQEIASLKALPGIQDLHDQCVALHRQKSANLMAQADFATLFQSLRDAPSLPPVELALIERFKTGLEPLAC